MASFKLKWLKQFGIGGRLFLAFVLLSSITIIVSGLSTNTYLDLRSNLYMLERQDIPGLESAAQLNNKSRIIAATAPLLVTADSDKNRQAAMDILADAITNMDELMRNLPAYDHYFRELIAQIKNSLLLLNQSTKRRTEVHREILLRSQSVFPIFQETIASLNDILAKAANADILEVKNQLYYFSGIVEKIANDPSFNALDYTFDRLQLIGNQIEQRLDDIPDRLLNKKRALKIVQFLQFGDRSKKLYQLKSEELDLVYQQSFLLQNSQEYIHQLAAQVNLYTDQTNDSITASLQDATKAIDANIKSILLLSLVSLIVAGAISWFYVRKNVLHRIVELQKNMRSIASAKLDTEVKIVGDDEVSDMARDLKYFQKTAIEVVKTNQRLAAEVEERILAEKQLQSAQNELIQAGKLAALGQLSVGITHEINQPLTAIASHVHTANLRLKNHQLDGVSHSLDKIKFLLNKVAVITRHLKSFARKTDAEVHSVEVNKVINDTLELMSGRLKLLNCDLKYTCSDDNLYVLAEPIRLEQVLVNLLSNAIDAVKNQSEQQIKLNVYQDNLEVFIEVHDTGVGISEDRLDYIFDPFYSDKDVGEGLGLGLSISYNIVQDFEGQIRVKSQLGKGSVFILVLKLADEREAN